MFFEVRIGADVVLFNLALVTRIKIGPPADDKATVTFFFTDGGEETYTFTPSVVQKLNMAVPRPTTYGSGGMG